MDRRFVVVLAAVVVILGGIFYFTSRHNSSGSSVSNSNSNSTQPTQHIEGQGKDGITLVEYGDYECPYCGQYYPIVKQIAADYNQQIYFQFRNLPLTQIHPNAFAGARAAEAAALQGKFWQMHDILYQTNEQYYANQSQPSWISASDPLTFFDSFAQQLGLNVSQFNSDYNSSQVNNVINADMAAFNKTGAQEATPTFFLNGKQISPTESLASFESYINAAIKKKGLIPPNLSSNSTGTSSASSPKSTQ